MRLKTILGTIVLISGISLGAIVFSFSGSSADKVDRSVKLYASCDSSQWTYQHVWINGVEWIYVYDCDGVLIDEYPAS